MSRAGIWGYAHSSSPAGAHNRARPLSANRRLTRAFSVVMATTLAFVGVGAVGSASASASQISNLSFTPLSTAGGATGHWSFSFETSSTGALTGSTVDPVDGSYIQLEAPTSTGFNQVNGCDYIINSTTSDGCAYVVEASTSPPTVDVYLPGSMSITADQDVTLSIDDVTNPPATTAYSGIEVSTSSDPGPVSASGGPFTAAESLSNLSFTPLSTAGGATGHWSFSFETSSTGALSGSTVDAGYGSYIQLEAPTSTGFNQVNGCDYIINSTTSDGCAYVVEASTLPPTVDVYLPGSMSITADQDVTLSIDDVTNPPATTAYSGIEVSTSSDPGPVSASGGPFTAAESLSNLSFTPLSTAGGATGHWSFSFETSSTGALSGSTVDAGYGSYIQLEAPTSTGFNQVNGCDYIINSTTSDGCAYVVEASTLPPTVDVYLPGSMSITADQDVTLSIDDVTNPPATTAYSGIEVSTSSDPGPVSASGGPFTAAQSVSGLGFSTGAGLGTATGVGGATVNWTIGFTASSTGGLTYSAVNAPYGSYIDIAGPSDVTFPSDSCDYQLEDVTTGTTSDEGGVGCPTPEVSGSEAVIHLPDNMTIAAGDGVSLTIDGVTNPAAGTSTAGFEFATSSDPSAISPTGAAFSEGASISGQVLDPNNNPVVGAAVQLCSVSTEFCADTDSLSGGTFSAFVPDGTYFASAFPTASEQLGTGEYQGQVTVSGTTAVSGIDITMSSPPSLPGGFSIITVGGATETSSTASPFLYWGSPFELQLSPSIFPSGETVVATQVVVQGTDIQTGDLVQQVVDIGGSVGGLPAGVVIGSQPIDVSMPALAPIHGEVSFSVNYQTYPSGTEPPGVI